MPTGPTSGVRAGDQPVGKPAVAALVAELPDVVYALWVGPDPGFEYVSPSVESLVGCTAAQCYADPALGASLLGTGDVARMGAWDQSPAGQAVEATVRCRHRDGRVVWLQHRCRRAVREDGRVVLSGVARDVTDQQHAIEAIAAGQEHYRLLAENASDIVYRAAPGGLCQWISPSVTAVLGWSPEQLVGTSIADLAHPEDAESVRAHRQRVLTESVPQGYEARFRAQDGSYRWLSVRGQPLLDAEGRPSGAVVSLRDVHEEVMARRALAASEERFEGALAEVDDIVIMTTARRGPDGRIVDFEYVHINAAGLRMMGRPAEEVLGHGLLELFPSHVGLGYFEEYVAAVETGQRRDVEVSDFDENGVRGSFQVTVWRYGDGYFMIGHDVTEKLRRERELRESERRYRLLAENASDVVMSTSPDGVYTWVSESVTGVLGWQPGELVGRVATEFVHPGDLPRLRRARGLRVPDAVLRGEFRFRCAEGSYRWVAATSRMASGEAGEGLGVVIGLVDITARKATEEQLAHAATHDPLTGLANRTLLMQEADRALSGGVRPGRATALLMLDLDNFKYVNDSLGHTVGDAVLCAVARRVEGCVRPGDLVARHGGDEILVLLRDLSDPVEAEALAALLVAECHQPVSTGGPELVATVSVGIAVADAAGPGRAAVDLIREADTAMYAAKAAGRDRVAVFSDDMRRAADDRVRIEQDLRGALDRGELAVWYQPEVDLGDGAVRAVEALLRWHRPGGTLWTAAQFIDVAEETGLILSLGTWVVQRACAHVAEWAAAHPDHPLVVRVNLSSLQLNEPDLLATLDDALRSSRADPGMLCVEITETVLLHDNAIVAANLNGIRDRGVRIAIDDFGTGYGSLSYLRRFPVHVLKIDRSFVTHIDTDDLERNLVAGIIALAGRLGISVTAEGVETPEQADALRALGCDGAQGYLYSPAIPWGELTRILRTGIGSMR